MNRQDIYKKTEKGSDEIRNRTYRLSQKLRSLLIMIDGTTPVGPLLGQAAALGDAFSMIVELEKQEFIKKIDDARPKTPAGPSGKSPGEEKRNGPAPSGDGALIDVVHLFTAEENKENAKKP